MKKINYILFLALIVLWAACEKNETAASETPQSINPEDLYAKTAFNLDMRDFAMAVNEAVNSNKELKKLIHEEAMNQFDGDYDVLITNIANRRISQDEAEMQTRSSKLRSVSSFTVADLLDDAFETAIEKSNDNSDFSPRKRYAKMRAVSSTASLVGELTEKYPELQVSVPVHLEDLEEPEYVPPVTFVTSEAYEGTSDVLVAYQGIEIDTLGRKTPPSKAVIVVGLNERFPLEEENENGEKPSKPTLSGIKTESRGIPEYYTYFDPINYVLEFSNFNFKMYLK